MFSCVVLNAAARNNDKYMRVPWYDNRLNTCVVLIEYEPIQRIKECMECGCVLCEET